MTWQGGEPPPAGTPWTQADWRGLPNYDVLAAINAGNIRRLIAECPLTAAARERLAALLLETDAA